MVACSPHAVQQPKPATQPETDATMSENRAGALEQELNSSRAMADNFTLVRLVVKVLIAILRTLEEMKDDKG